MLQGFKEFITRGNVVDLAVGVIIGAAFNQVVTALNEKFLMPIIAGLFGQPNFDSVLMFHIGESAVMPGAIITALVNFLIVAAALYFFVVVPINKMRKPAVVEEAAPTEDVVLLTQIRDLLARQN
ncbi:large conductance mechanosensitive channel [Arcanobacterium wilhelmae]|uniref:Large-conductance mechanosensitive channel n=1 Tax=Arcanobacterium wilhelmae TaxID=1803177 RepID=A0ABT9NBT3_9ACTO|nr:large conductance mechanosensitive channel protein MscL [Arcanobacterium wilhelmae]MDP9801173.1 large conductance mechanosensitive channel [Arcanobacterium wilhelmae]WFN90525.1 large conductance mechanosensitive channel protein MscL [Arcanobacterium wilhelmae]